MYIEIINKTIKFLKVKIILWMIDSGIFLTPFGLNKLIK